MQWIRFIAVFAVLLFLASCSRTYIQPEAPVRVVEVPRPMGPLIVLDAGHGGKDRGCEDSPEDCQEKELTLETVYLVKAYLEKMGYRTFLTRKEDRFVPLDDRVSMANESQAALFVSVHFNAATNKKAKGIEVFYCDSEENVVRKESSKRLAKLLLDKAIACTEATSRGVKTGNLRVIKKTTMPAALIEGGFLTHPEERSRCQDPIYLNALAWGIARGIDDYFKTPCP